MTDEVKKRGRGRPKGAGGKFNLSKFKQQLPEIQEAGDLIKAGTMSSLMELIKLSLAKDEYENASCTNRLGAHKELLNLGIRFLEDDIVKILKEGAEEEAKEEDSDKDQVKSFTSVYKITDYKTNKS